MFVISSEEESPLVMRTVSVKPGGKLPAQLPLLFQSNVPPVVVVHDESANALWADVKMRRVDATRTVSLTRIAILPISYFFPDDYRRSNAETYTLAVEVYSIKRFIKSTAFHIHFVPFLIHFLQSCRSFVYPITSEIRLVKAPW
jgi:hypothetical protein